MNIILYNNSDPKNKLNKDLSNVIGTLTGTLREQTSIMNCTITITGDFNNANYCYIPEFGRYYFITDKESVRNGVWALSLTVDVLMSFKNDILNSSGLLERVGNMENKELADGYYQFQSNPKYITKTTSKSLGTNSYYILTCAGGQ